MQNNRCPFASISSINKYPLVLYKPYTSWYVAIEWFPDSYNKPRYEILHVFLDTEQCNIDFEYCKDYLKLRQVVI